MRAKYKFRFALNSIFQWKIVIIWNFFFYRGACDYRIAFLFVEKSQIYTIMLLIIKFYFFICLVMIPVSSTVIPLPVYKVGYGLGFISKDKKTSFKPEDGIKLITSKCRITNVKKKLDCRILFSRRTPLRYFLFAFHIAARSRRKQGTGTLWTEL